VSEEKFVKWQQHVVIPEMWRQNWQSELDIGPFSGPNPIQSSGIKSNS